MGMMIGTSGSHVKTMTFKTLGGTVTGGLSVSKQAKKKKFNYNFKEISVQIMNAKTSGSARKVTATANSKIAMLRQKLMNSEYDSKELESALAHALKLGKISAKKMKNLQQEERISRQEDRSCFNDNDKIEEELDIKEDSKEDKDLKRKAEELEKLIKEYEKSIEQSEQMQESNNWLNEIMEITPEDMSLDDLTLLKKKHRAEEMKKIMEADLQYLKAIFDRLAKEKQTVGSGINNGISSDSENGVSLELVGMEIPVQLTETAALPESGGLDIMV